MLFDVKNYLFNEISQSIGKEKKTIVVAMSGGVDSSTVAALLNDIGHKVIGITLQLYDHGIAINKKGACCAGIDIYDAQMAAQHIGIPHYVFNYESTFREDVIIPFADSYISGKTPIPCILCNQKIKFRDLLKASVDLNADYMATGHYISRKFFDNRYCLYKGIDDHKDQSYFLFSTTQDQINKSIFPLGSIHKNQTRDLAKEYGLVVADKSDSQDICFVPNGDYRKIVLDVYPESKKIGEIKFIDGNIIGTHEGIINYTVGQRKGLNISYKEPLYVLEIDKVSNTITVGPREFLKKRFILVQIINWLDNDDWNEYECDVKLRYTQKTTKARILSLVQFNKLLNENNIQDLYKDYKNSQFYSEIISNKNINLNSDYEINPKISSKMNYIQNNDNNEYNIVIELFEDYFGITPGQACVFYNNDRLLGGGWIISSLQ
ncbi:tRNA 2-thiouridine(34) synthase MnmA [Lyticum sinuosum]|uniref:tRNA-specific 2-thiouridylase MnmA n=1 Tax=Lyticum sinuosum TaxID=1332059 RepID=A0AAE4VM88_9RICK|nr:tRNA 2-thiouridine(34) synthase MnmA [Lyticum sinuosum]MDZ5761244.1 tRNA-specific 2-thiouridylase MnmA [Lyticum sinuosum]